MSDEIGDLLLFVSRNTSLESRNFMVMCNPRKVLCMGVPKATNRTFEMNDDCDLQLM